MQVVSLKKVGPEESFMFSFPRTWPWAPMEGRDIISRHRDYITRVMLEEKNEVIVICSLKFYFTQQNISQLTPTM